MRGLANPEFPVPLLTSMYCVWVTIHIFLILGCLGAVFTSKSANLGPIMINLGHFAPNLAANGAF
jgi:hypothetical protein